MAHSIFTSIISSPRRMTICSSSSVPITPKINPYRLIRFFKSISCKYTLCSDKKLTLHA
eukprot:UN15886